jgi:hypothetical protein
LIAVHLAENFMFSEGSGMLAILNDIPVLANAVLVLGPSRGIPP